MKKFFTVVAAVAASALFAVSCGGAKEVVDVNGEWSVVSIDGNAVETIMNEVVISFDDANYSANTGVNMINGSYTIEDGVLTLGEGMMTRMAGDPAAMDQETSFVNAIKEPLCIKLNGESLELLDADGNVKIALAKK
ncbi:MAG: META domain-containing protein [Bacteroidales bacterium]|nr:META domain-containing protein [Candidatus Cryptobacteroides caccocaballi]